LEFSLPVPHADPQVSFETVMMTCIQDKEGIFVHASDIQLLDDKTVELILAWQLDIVLASGSPLYLAGFSPRQQQHAWETDYAWLMR
jgi:predicted metallo-beta-lactamase superfamily hydrolase